MLTRLIQGEADGGQLSETELLQNWEGRVAIGRFLPRFPGYALAGPVQRDGRVRFRGFLRVPLQGL